MLTVLRDPTGHGVVECKETAISHSSVGGAGLPLVSQGFWSGQDEATGLSLVSSRTLSPPSWRQTRPGCCLSPSTRRSPRSGSSSSCPSCAPNSARPPSLPNRATHIECLIAPSLAIISGMRAEFAAPTELLQSKTAAITGQSSAGKGLFSSGQTALSLMAHKLF